MNKVMLIGNVGKDPVVRYLDAGVCVAQVSLATTEKGYVLQNGTQVPDRTEWHTVIFWRRQAEVVEKYVHKGDKLYVEGKIQSRDWTDKQGATHKSIEIMADGLELLTPKSMSQTTSAATNNSNNVVANKVVEKEQVAPKTAGVVTPSNNGDEYPF
jgi:single-strand DNA-binding protein